MSDQHNINQRLVSRLEIRDLFPNARLEGEFWLLGDRYGAAGRSLKIRSKDLSWRDYATGEYGGIIDLLYPDESGFRTKCRLAEKEYLGGGPASGHPVEPGRPAKRQAPGSRGLAAPAVQTEPIDSAPPEPAPHRQARITEHDYRDPEGRPLFKVVRRESFDQSGRQIKKISQKHIDSSGRWVNRAYPGIRPVYNSDLLRQHSEANVYLVEGEKAADSLVERHHLAVTLSGGSSTPLEKHDLSSLRNRNIILWPDNDDAGRRFMLRIMKAVRASYIVMLTGDEPQGHDAADIAGSPEEMQEYIKKRNRPVATPEEYCEAVGCEPEEARTAGPPGTIDPSGRPFPCRPLGYDKNYFYFRSSKASGGHLIKCRRTNTAVKDIIGSLSLPWERKEYGWLRFRTSRDGEIVPFKYEENRTHEADCLTGLALTSGVNFDKALHRGLRVADGVAHWNNQGEIVTGGNDRPVLEPFPSETKFAVAEDSATLEDRIEFYRMNSRWNKADHKVANPIVAGHMLASAICGALEFRPTLVVSGETGTGKTLMITQIAKELSGSNGEYMSSNKTSIASVWQAMKDGAVSLYIDEFKDEGATSKLTQAMLGMIRKIYDRGQTHSRGSKDGSLIVTPCEGMATISSTVPALGTKEDRRRQMSVRLEKQDSTDRPDFRGDPIFLRLRRWLLDNCQDVVSLVTDITGALESAGIHDKTANNYAIAMGIMYAMLTELRTFERQPGERLERMLTRLNEAAGVEKLDAGIAGIISDFTNSLPEHMLGLEADRVYDSRSEAAAVMDTMSKAMLDLPVPMGRRQLPLRDMIYHIATAPYQGNMDHLIDGVDIGEAAGWRRRAVRANRGTTAIDELVLSGLYLWDIHIRMIRGRLCIAIDPNSIRWREYFEHQGISANAWREACKQSELRPEAGHRYESVRLGRRVAHFFCLDVRKFCSEFGGSRVRDEHGNYAESLQNKLEQYTEQEEYDPFSPLEPEEPAAPEGTGSLVRQAKAPEPADRGTDMTEPGPGRPKKRTKAENASPPPEDEAPPFSGYDYPEARGEPPKLQSELPHLPAPPARPEKDSRPPPTSKKYTPDPKDIF